MPATLFDFDGVLVDSEPAHLAAFNDVLEPLGLSIGESDYADRYMSYDDAGVFQAVLRHAGRTVNVEHVRALVEAKQPRFLDRFAGSFRVFPGAVELIERRAALGPVGIVSGALETEIVFALDKMGVAHRISLLVSAESVSASKPDPAPFLKALSDLRRTPHAGAVVVVEDSLGGVEAAKKAGLRCAAVTHSFGRVALLHAGADVVVDELRALTDPILDGYGA
jgi:beta-phosphoglucomutase